MTAHVLSESRFRKVGRRFARLGVDSIVGLLLVQLSISSAVAQFEPNSPENCPTLTQATYNTFPLTTTRDQVETHAFQENDARGLQRFAKQTAEQRKRTLASVKKVHNHPLYVMRFEGDYVADQPLETDGPDAGNAGFACSLFFAAGNINRPLYGRNFDWQDHPALLLWTNPSDGYASISMVDISYLGYAKKDGKMDSPEGRLGLLDAPLIPFDGMNEHGLTVGMAAVPNSSLPHIQGKPTLGSLQLIRLMLDRAKTVDEALKLFDEFNVEFMGGPQIHFLIADPSGKSALVELKDGKHHVLRGDEHCHQATNFHLHGNEHHAPQLCPRYAKIQRQLNNTQGTLDVDQSFKLLKDVAQRHTRWSMVYDMSRGDAHVVMSREFQKPLKFSLKPKQAQKKAENAKSIDQL